MDSSLTRTLQITRHGGPNVLRLVETPKQPLAPNGIRIQVKAAGINFADLMMRMGMYPEAPKPPFTPGYEVAGVAVEVGRDVRTIREGDRVVAGCRFGGYATEILLPEHQVRRTPMRLSDEEAAAIPVNFMTAWIALQEMARVRLGDRVLIQSAAGGVGLAAVQIAQQAGAHVVGLVGSLSKADVVRSFGAVDVWTNERWESAGDEELGGFDIILDATGGKSLKRSFDRLGPGGRVINFGMGSLVHGEKRSILSVAAGLAQTPLFTPFKLMFANKGVFGLNMLQLFEDLPKGESSLLGRSFDRVLAGFEEGRYQVKVGKTFPLAQAGEAHTYLQSRANIGKVVLTC